MIALVPVRHGVLPLGGLDVVAEVGGSAWLIGSNCGAAAVELGGVASEIRISEVGPFRPAAWATALAPRLAETVVLPASPDGRDLAARLAAATGRPLLAGCTEIGVDRASVVRVGGRVLDEVAFDEPIIATLQPGVRSIPTATDEPASSPVDLPLGPLLENADPQLLQEHPPDPATMDLAEAPRIVSGGAGLGGPPEFDELSALASLLGASMGGTRVVMDAGLIPFERQIGTTGITVDPELYLAVGISGAVQHTAGLGQPDHVISVNTDPHCPMMAMADLAIECDGAEFVAAMVARLRR